MSKITFDTYKYKKDRFNLNRGGSVSVSQRVRVNIFQIFIAFFFINTIFFHNLTVASVGTEPTNKDNAPIELSSSKSHNRIVNRDKNKTDLKKDTLEKAMFELEKIQNVDIKKIPKRNSKSKLSPSISDLSNEKIGSKSSSLYNNSQNPEAKADNSSPGIFSLHEPELNLFDRQWKYQLGVRIQQIKPKGVVHSEIVGDLSLNKYDRQWLPSLEFGVSADISDFSQKSIYLSPFKWMQTGSILLQLGYNSYQVPVVFESGYRAPQSTRLNTIFINSLFLNESILSHRNSLFLKSGFALGKFFYTQTSLNDMAQFSKGILFGTILLGLNYHWSKDWSISGDYLYRHPLQASSIELQRHNLELGVKVQW